MVRCNICGKEFDSPFKLGGHKSSHSRRKGMITNRKEVTYRCINCNKEMKTYDARLYKKFCSRNCRKEYSKKLKDEKIIYGVKNSEIESYRKKQIVCEICGKKEVCNTSCTRKENRTNKLCADHDHKTNLFRGLLCNSCNRKLAWYENEKDNIERYLRLNSDFNYVQNKLVKEDVTGSNPVRGAISPSSSAG